MNLKNKNVLLIFQGGNLGGAERQAFGLADFLVAKNNCVVDVLFVYSDKTSKEFDAVLTKSKIHKTYFFGEPYLYLKREISIKNLKRLKWSLQYLFKLKKGLMKSKYDIVIPFQNTPSKMAYYLYKLLPTVEYTFWHQLGLDILKHDVFESIAINNMPCIIGNAENCLDIFTKDYKVNPEKLHILPQYLSLVKERRDKKNIKKHLTIPEHKFVFGMVAHFKPFKYHDLLLNVFNKIHEKYPNTHLVLMGNKDNDAGTLELYHSLKKDVEKYHLVDSVSLLSNADIIDVLNVLDVGVLLSQIEGSPNVVMEYMSYGIPVIASAHPGCKALLKGSNLLVNNNENEVYLAMENLIISKENYAKESAQNLIAIQKYTVDNYVEDLEIILTKNFN